MKGNKWMEIRSERQKGLQYTELARKHNIDPRTAKKYAQSETKPDYQLTGPKPSKLDPYKHQIDVGWMRRPTAHSEFTKSCWSRVSRANIRSSRIMSAQRKRITTQKQRSGLKRRPDYSVRFHKHKRLQRYAERIVELLKQQVEILEMNIHV